MKSLPKEWIVHLTTAVLLTLFLCYIDEGHYNFKWMLNWDNWISFIIYVALFWTFLLLISKMVNRIFKGSLQAWLSTYAGSIFALLFVILLVISII